MSHILFQDFCIFCNQYLGRLWYAKVLRKPLATIEQYRISFRYDNFPRNRGTPFSCMKSDIQTQLIKILVYYSALQCKKVQSSIEKFHWLKKIRKTENFSFNLNIRVPLESVNLFLHVFLCRKVILTTEHYIKLLTIFIWKFAIFWSWQLVLWNLGQLAPASFFYLQQAHDHHVWDIQVVA